MTTTTDKPAQDHAAEAARIAADRAAAIARFLEMVADNEKSAANARAIGAEFLARQYDEQAADCRKFAADLS
jgi:hypothetical protein